MPAKRDIIRSREGRFSEGGINRARRYNPHITIKIGACSGRAAVINSSRALTEPKRENLMQKHIGMKHVVAPALAAALMLAGCNVKDEALNGPSNTSTLPMAALVLGHKADLILYDNSTGAWTVGKSNGSAFVPTGVNWLSFNMGTVFEAVSADVNGDGKDDLVLRNKVTSQIQVALSNGSTFGAPATWLGSWVAGSGYVLMAADVNADHRADLIAKNTTNGSWRVALSTGTSFTNSGDWITGFASGAGYDVFVADVDNDLKADLVAHEKTTGKLLFARSFGTSFVTAGQIGTSFPSTSATAFLVADVTGDGKADFIAKDDNGNWIVYRSTGSNFAQDPQWGSGFAVGSGYALYAIDVTGDGKADLVARDRVSAGTGNWYVYQSSGTHFVNGAIWVSNYGVGSQFTGFLADASGN
jgi:hypothetical protein